MSEMAILQQLPVRSIYQGEEPNKNLNRLHRSDG
jgi:hypothetical protein